MINWLLKWNRKRRSYLAYRIIRNEYERHRDAGHRAHFHAIKATEISFVCVHCPNQHPSRRRK